jgi:hypothetical protein
MAASISRREGPEVYGELASIREVVDLQPEEALDAAEAFLVQLGYVTLAREAASLTVKRDEPDRPKEMGVLNLTVAVYPQPGGGVVVRIRGNDREGVRERQSEFAAWAESLPKREPAVPPGETETGEMPPAQRHANEAQETGNTDGPGPRLG